MITSLVIFTAPVRGLKGNIMQALFDIQSAEISEKIWQHGTPFTYKTPGGTSANPYILQMGPSSGQFIHLPLEYVTI
jgi:hypothetical protein